MVAPSLHSLRACGRGALSAKLKKMQGADLLLVSPLLVHQAFMAHS
jgi:hypothetical protein